MQDFEICKLQEQTDEDKKAGRISITMSVLEVHDDGKYDQYNKNGIHWEEQYILDNLDSIKGVPYVVSFLDDDKSIISDHGNQSFDENGNVQYDGDTVGYVESGWIDTVEIEGVSKKVLMTKGYLFTQRYPNLVKALKEDLSNGIHIKGSVEINGKAGSKKITYLNGDENPDGTKKLGRTPTVYDFAAQAILGTFVQPADDSSEIIELNTLNQEQQNQIQPKESNVKKVKSKQTIEINELSFDDIATLVTRAFNKSMQDKDNEGYYYRYWIYKFYPVSNRVIMYNDSETPYKYYSTTYEILNNSVSIGDITEVEMDFKPINDEQEVNINSALIKDILLKNSQKEEKLNMEKDTAQDVSVVELNSQIVEKVNEINTLAQQMKDKDVEINTLKEKEVELNQAILDATKTIETLKKENIELNSEIEPLRVLQTEKEIATAQAEINAYFETVKTENGFTETELNTLKTEYVDKCNLSGLKSAETELCVKKVKEMKKVDKIETEINSAKTDDTLFFSTKIETIETNTSNDGSELFA